MRTIKSVTGKAKTLAKEGLDPLSEGLRNFNIIDKEIESLAKERMKTCLGCPHFETEPVDFLRVEDQRIPELSNKMCGDCFCALSYKTRQSKTICTKWQK